MQDRPQSIGRTAPGSRIARAGLVALAIALVVLATACATRPIVSIDERYPVESLSRVRLLVEDGAVTVAEGRPGQILVTGEHPEGAHDYAATVAAGEARIELRKPRGLRGLRPVLGQRGAHLDVILPPGVTVEVEASNGPVTVTGPFRLERVKSANGAVHVNGALGALAIETSNGPTSIQAHRGQLEIKGSNGQVDVVEQRDGGVSITTSNGAIRYHGTIEGAGANLFETSNGFLEVIVAGTPSFTLDATTSNGGITSKFALLDGTKSDSRLTGRVGDGPTKLVVRTSNGAIEVR